jgi:hypothetical protein
MNLTVGAILIRGMVKVGVYQREGTGRCSRSHKL